MHRKEHPSDLPRLLRRSQPGTIASSRVAERHQKIADRYLLNQLRSACQAGVIFEITPIEGQTRLRFAHVGLVPEHGCFDVCSNAWRFYITDSLRRLITTGVGQPNPKEQAWSAASTLSP